MKVEKVLDIHSKGEYPANVLSNFYPNAFVFDAVPCASMEGLLQSLKTKKIDLQKKICGYCGKNAKFFFRHKFQNLRWKLTGKLYWKGRVINRYSDEYQCFLDEAYKALCNNKTFVDALIKANGVELTHYIGRKDMRKTVLTEYEFISRLKKCREWAVNRQ